MQAIIYLLYAGITAKVVKLKQHSHQNNIHRHMCQWQNYTIHPYHENKILLDFPHQIVAEIVKFYRLFFSVIGKNRVLCDMNVIFCVHLYPLVTHKN